jgi:micrococcal nuclease
MGLPARLLLAAALVLVAGCGSVAVTDEGAPTETAPVSATETVATATTPAPGGPTATPTDFEPTETNEPGEYEGVPDTDAGAVCLRRAGHDATNYTVSRVEDATVTLAFDPLTDRRGGYDRLLAYVYVDGANLNRDIVATGRARVFDTEFALQDAFEESEAAARAESRGLWGCQDG